MRACFTTRAGGASAKPWDSLNLATRVGDAPQHVARNRALLSAALKLPQGPLWLRQEHGNRVVDAAQVTVDVVADGVVTHGPGAVCAVLVADCVPILLCDRGGDHVGAAHAGWRGIECGVVEQAVAAMPAPPARLRAWIGPAIGAEVYEVGADLRARLADLDTDAAHGFARRNGRWYMDLRKIVGRRLTALGVASITATAQCVYADPMRFFSYRRDGVTGRMAALIWIER